MAPLELLQIIDEFMTLKGYGEISLEEISIILAVKAKYEVESKCVSRYRYTRKGAYFCFVGVVMKEFILLNKIRQLNMYTEQYIFSSFPKKDMALKIRLEENLYYLVEYTIKANINKGNIRGKYQTDLITAIYLLDYYIGITYEKKIIIKKRFEAFLTLLLEIKKIALAWKENEEKI